MPANLEERAMKAADVMVTDVVTVGPDASVRDVAEILLRHRISAVPVVADGKIAGIVSEGDLIRRTEGATERRRPRWLDYFISREVLAAEFVKSHARKVADVMTREVVTADPDTPLGEIASRLERNGIKRVPIVRDGKLVGIVSRANLLQALAGLKEDLPSEAAPSDAIIRGKVEAELKTKPWAKPLLINVIVRDGTVDLWGLVDSEAERQAVRVLAEVTPGVRAVNDNLAVRPAFER
jgi:CBS domain-containing protein